MANALGDSSYRPSHWNDFENRGYVVVEQDVWQPSFERAETLAYRTIINTTSISASIIFVSPTIMRIDEVSFSPIQHLLHKNSVHE